MPNIYLADAEHFLERLAEQPIQPDRDHQVLLAIAHALTSIAHDVNRLVDGGAR